MYLRNKQAFVAENVEPAPIQEPNSTPIPRMQQEQQQQQRGTQQTGPTDDEKLDFDVNQRFVHGRLDELDSMLHNNNEGGKTNE